MCEANAYLLDGDKEILFMESVDIIEPYNNGLKLVDIFGAQKFVQAKIKDMNLVNHRIVLQKTYTPEELKSGNIFLTVEDHTKVGS